MSVEKLFEKWEPVLNHEDLPPIENRTRRGVVAQLLENTEKDIESGGTWSAQSLLAETPTNHTGSAIDNYDPVLISLVRRAAPKMVAYDLAGVQPMTGPTGLIFAMRARYANQTGTEAFYNEADTDFSGLGTHGDSLGSSNTANVSTGTGMSTANAEALGSNANNVFNEMAFSIEKISVTAKSRALKAEYTTELAQDLKAIHGLDAESELANILSDEILAEINREIVRTIYVIAKPGAQDDTATAGTFDLDVDANGRWSVERFKGLLFQIEREANKVARQTRRGKGNILMCSQDVASALQMAGVLDYTPALQSATNLTVDESTNTFVGVLNGRIKVFVDPYSVNEYFVIGYKGSSAMDAGLFYAPYVPLQMVRAIGENTFQPKIGFKTRYGMVANPFAEGTSVGNGALNTDSNVYYRRVAVTNLM